MIRLNQNICADLDQALSREWLETNGLGGFASSTITGANTRRYHGLLTAATNPPVGRVLLLSKLEETFVIAGERYQLSTNEYDGAIYPSGFANLESFRLDPFPIFTYACGKARLEKSVFMVHGSNTTVVQYRLLDSLVTRAATLEVKPLLAFRNYHSTTHENSELDPSLQQDAGSVSMAAYPGLPRLYIAHNAASVHADGEWYRNFLYRVERERGLDHREDLFSPFLLSFSLSKRKQAVVIASTDPQQAHYASDFRKKEVARRVEIASHAAVDDDFVRALTTAADQFLVQRGDGHTIIAGYPWFTDWGRDTMISLPGLTLFSGRADVAKDILRTFAHHVDQGMLPNRFPETGEATEFNTVDATLWFFEAARAYAQVTGNYEFIRESLYPVFAGIIDWHIKGTRYNIHMMENGLLHAGEAGVQLTWMDAKVGDWVVTPRSGMPVEIQALWFNALKVMEDFATRFGCLDDRIRFRSISDLLKETFNQVFWNEQAGCLYDVINRASDGVSKDDASIRPNQILAVSLTHTMLSPKRARAVVDLVERELLTPCGLRTLNRANPNYAGHYQGDARSRDGAYHQGTVWPWLLGPFVTAYIKVNGNTDEVRQRTLQMLKPLEAHLSQAGLGQISEIFDGDEPHVPRGCFAQAWSVAEVLRALCQDVYRS